MRFPFLQVERRAFAQAEFLAALLDVELPTALGYCTLLWRHALDVEEGAPVRTHASSIARIAAELRWRGDKERLRDALVEAGLLGKDLRIRGTSRYSEASERGKANARKRWGRDATAMQRHATALQRHATETETETEKQEEISAQRSQPALLELEPTAPRREKTAKEKGRTGSRRPASENPDPGSRASDALVEDFLQATGGRYAWQGAKDGAALSYLLKHAPLEEVRRRWRAGLAQCGWLHTATVAQLRAKWNDLGTAPLSQAELDRQRREEVARMLAEQDAESKGPLASGAGAP